MQRKVFFYVVCVLFYQKKEKDTLSVRIVFQFTLKTT